MSTDILEEITKEQHIRYYCNFKGFVHINLDDNEIDIIYDYIENNINNMNDSNKTSNILLYFGRKHCVKKEFNAMKKYYLEAIELNNSHAMNALGEHYFRIEQNFIEMKKYLKMSIKLNNPNAMRNLGDYYQHIKPNFTKMEKYYTMAIELNHSGAMNQFGNYYCNIKNYVQMKKYYIMAIKFGNRTAEINLLRYYETYPNVEITFMEYLECMILTKVEPRIYKKISLKNIIFTDEIYNMLNQIPDRILPKSLLNIKTKYNYIKSNKQNSNCMDKKDFTFVSIKE